MGVVVGGDWIHIGQESLALILGLFVLWAIAPLARSHSKSTPELYWLQVWAVFGVVFTTLHVCLAVTGVITGLDMSSIIPLTYLPERVSDSLFALFCAIPPTFSSKTKILWTSTSLILGFTLLGVYFMATGSSDVVGTVGRPQELLQVLPAAIALGAMLGVKKKFGKFLKWSTLATLMGGVTMLFSTHLFDLPFVLAHYFKILSYLVILTNVVLLIKNLKRGT